jgi:hypothetical protein
MSYGDYLYYQRQYGTLSADAAILTSTDYSAGNGTAIVSAKNANYTVFIQKILVSVTTYAAKTWTFQDSAGTPVPGGFISIPAAAPTAAGDATYEIDFGPKGWALTVGKNLLLKMSAAGAAALVHVECYQQQTAALDTRAGASLQ